MDVEQSPLELNAAGPSLLQRTYEGFAQQRLSAYR